VTQAQLHTPASTPPPTGAPAPAPVLTLKRVLAMLVLPASLLPVLLLGPGELNAPRHLARQAWAAAVRLERRLEPARSYPRPLAPAAARVSLGKLYGNWRAFPQIGREGLVRPGPVQ
jgi:hypothetical protein